MNTKIYPKDLINLRRGSVLRLNRSKQLYVIVAKMLKCVNGHGWYDIDQPEQMKRRSFTLLYQPEEIT